jgi:hypothetical protein
VFLSTPNLGDDDGDALEMIPKDVIDFQSSE